MREFDEQEFGKSNYSTQESYNTEALDTMTKSYSDILTAMGEDPTREGLAKTPERAAKAMAFLTQGYQVNAEDILNSAKFKEDYNQMIIVKDIEFYSLCEHHILPFMGKVHIAYIPNGYITGLSKLARVVETFSRRLQVQERLTVDIHDCIRKVLNPKGVAVVIEATHTCMQMRGVRSQNSSTTTAEYSGGFMTSLKTREEFLSLIQKK